MRWISALCLLLSGPAYGASFYISTTGSDTNGCTNQTTDACATFPRCAAVMAAGDTCYAADGTYYTTGTNGWYFDVTGGSVGSPKRFTSTSQDATKVTIKATNPTTENTIYINGAGTKGKYLEISYVTIEGRMEIVDEPEAFTAHHNIFRCPNTGTGGGNNGPIIVRGTSTGMAKHLWIYENRFVMEDSCPAARVGDANVTFVTVFHTYNMILEKNDFLNSTTTRAMWTTVDLKRGNKDAHVRYNYFSGGPLDTNGAVRMMDCDGDTSVNQFGDRSSIGGSARCNNKVYQNLFDGLESNGVYMRGAVTARQEWAYNNTFIGSNSAGAVAVGVGIELDAGKTEGAEANNIFNNIIYKPTTTGYGYIGISLGSTRTYPCLNIQGIVDNNLYWPAGAPWHDCSNYSTTTLATWKAHAAPYEASSLQTDPLFEAGSYQLSASSPARLGGYGGSYPTFIGAYDPSTTTQIGCSWHSSCYAYGAGTAQYGNVRRVDLKGVSVK